MTPKYAVFEGNPVRSTDTEAWWFFEGKWQKMDIVEILMGAAVMSRADYERQFPNLLPLPQEAFR